MGKWMGPRSSRRSHWNGPLRAVLRLQLRGRNVAQDGRGDGNDSFNTHSDWTGMLNLPDLWRRLLEAQEQCEEFPDSIVVFNS